jgi:hypothetical protein
MGDTPSFLFLEQPCDSAIDWVTRQIGNAGLEVVRTFDLHLAQYKRNNAQASCPCPHHGTEQCDCQMAVLLVYGGECQPISIVVHGYNGQTWFSVVDTPQQPADPRLEAVIRLVLTPRVTTASPNHSASAHSASSPPSNRHAVGQTALA